MMDMDATAITTKRCIICGLPIGRRAYFYSTSGQPAHRSCGAMRDAQGHEVPQLRNDGRWI